MTSKTRSAAAGQGKSSTEKNASQKKKTPLRKRTPKKNQFFMFNLFLKIEYIFIKINWSFCLIAPIRLTSKAKSVLSTNIQL